MTRPSLFGHAPSELAQDAVFAWLLEWAAPKYMTTDLPIHNVGRAFLDALFAAAEPPLPALGEVHSVEVSRQHKNVDLLVVVNESRALIMEDKVHAGEHGDQLARYLQAIGVEASSYSAGIHAVYVKTGGPTSQTGLQAKGFGYLSRSEILGTLRKGLAAGVTNDILVDFVAHLEKTDREFDSWRNVHPTQWQSDDRLWETVFHELCGAVPASGWRWLPNSAGGQYGLWLHGVAVEPNNVLYVQANSRGRLHVRLSTTATTTKERRELRERWSAALLSRPDAGDWIRRPSRTAVGRTMAIADFVVPWLHPDPVSSGADVTAMGGTIRACAEWLANAVGSPTTPFEPPDAP